MGDNGIMYCPKCGQQNQENNFKCVNCSFLLHASPPKVVVTDDGTLGGLIPYRNAKALWAYYLGVFSFIPCVGIPVGIAALLLGILGLRFANEHPEAKGKVHAWIGIVAGGIFALLYIALTIFTMIYI